MELAEIAADYNRMVNHYRTPERANRTEKGWYLCPSCKKRVKPHHTYCSKCGKRLRWSE